MQFNSKIQVKSYKKIIKDLNPRDNKVLCCE